MASRYPGLGNTIGSVAGEILGSIGGSFLGSPTIGAKIGAGLGGAAGGGFQALANRNNNMQNSQNQVNPGGNWFTGNEGGIQRVSPYSDWQSQLRQQSSQQAFEGLQNPYAGFDPIRQQAISQFHNQTVPSLAERFTSMGSNALSSGAFASQLSSAGSELAQGLAALQAQYGLQNRNSYLQQLGLGLNPEYQLFEQAPSGGFVGGLGELFQQAAPTLGKLGAKGLGAYLGAGQGQGGSAFRSAVINGLQGV